MFPHSPHTPPKNTSPAHPNCPGYNAEAGGWNGLQSYQQSMEDNEEEAYLREDLTGIAFDISQSNFNVRQFKKSHGAKPIRPANQQLQARTVSRLFTEPNQTNPSEMDSNSITHQSKTMSQGLHKALKYNDNFITPASKNRQNKFFGKGNIKINSQITKSAQQIQLPSAKKKFTSTERIKGGSLTKYEKEWSRGKIKQRCIEEWLNAILIQYCHDEYFDRNIANCALKKLGVDENSLVAKGFQSKNVTRLYRGLFVFGMGFNELISELTNGNMEVTKIVWRIYSIILEYCSKGGMETVIGEMHRDNAVKVTELSNEIAKRQEIIEKNEELNEEKNNEIYREIKRLREENINLTNQKTVLSEEYSATEQAFGEEVGLRLKFETRINEIYGLHRELGIKHHKLFQQFGTKVEQLRIQADKYFQAARKSQELKETGIKLREELILLRERSKREGEYIRQIAKERVQLKDSINKLEFQLIENKTRISELKNKTKQSEKEISNLKAMLQLRQKSSKETHSEYQITLQENNRLYIQLSDQRKVMEEYEKEKNNFNSKIISIVSENSFNKRKLDELQKRYDALDEKYKEALKRIDTLVLEDEIKTKSEENYKSYYVNSQQNIGQMHRINIANEEELAFLRKYHKNMEKVLDEKKDIINKLKNQAEAASTQAEKYKFELNQLQSDYRVLQEQAETNGRILVVKQQKLEVLREKHEQNVTSLSKQIASQSQELNVLRGNVDTIMTHLKNEKFERSTLNNSYIQSLKIIESKNVTERSLNVKISLLEGEIDREKNRYQILEKNMIILISDFGALQERLEDTLDKQRKILEIKKDYRNPMIFEDMQAQIHRHIDVNNELRSKVAFLEMQIQKQIQLARQNLEKTVQSYRWEINKLTKEFQKLQQIKTNELQFQKQQYKNQKAKLQQLEEVSESYRKKIHERSTSEREQIYKFMLQEKKKQIQNQFAEMEKLQDELSKSKMQVAELNANYEQDYMNKYGDQAGKSSEQLRKELEHEYDLKFRQLQRSIRSQYAKKEQNWKEESDSYIKNLSLQEILRVKDIKIESAIQQLSQHHDSRISGGDSFLNRQHFEKRDLIRYKTDTKKRKQMGRILKQAFEYYQN